MNNRGLIEAANYIGAMDVLVEFSAVNNRGLIEAAPLIPEGDTSLPVFRGEQPRPH